MNRMRALALSALLASLGFSGAASAGVIAKTEAHGAAIVLTDEVDESLCPVGSHMALAILPEGKQVPGCWKLLEGEKVGILWLAIDIIPQGYFEGVPKDLES